MPPKPTKEDELTAKEIVEKMRNYSFLTEMGCAHVGQVDFSTWEVMISKALSEQREKDARIAETSQATHTGKIIANAIRSEGREV